MRELNIAEFSHFNDKTNVTTATHRGTDVKVYVGGTDILLYRGTNKIILPGAEFTATQHFDIPRQYITPSYNTELSLENSVFETPSTPEKVYLFCVGTDGCGRENSQVYEVNYGKWCAPEYLVPFRYPLITEDITEAKKEIYHGETFVEINLKITEEECREYFINTVGINEARINTISLCTAWKKEINGKEYYQDIRPLTKYNMPNEQLIELSKGLDIVYQIYY